MLRISSLFKNLVMSFPVKERRAKIDSARRPRRDLGKWTLTVAKGDRESSPSLERRRSCLRRTKGLLRHAFSECEIWAYRSVASETDQTFLSEEWFFLENA